MGQTQRHFRLIVDGKTLGIYPEDLLQGLEHLRGIVLEEVSDDRG